MAELVNARRLAYGKALVELGKTHPDVVVLSADVSNSDHSMFGDAYPDRFFNVGIAEPSLVDAAVGLSYGGKIPFANTFAIFFATRASRWCARTVLRQGQRQADGRLRRPLGLFRRPDPPLDHRHRHDAQPAKHDGRRARRRRAHQAAAPVADWKGRSTSACAATRCPIPRRRTRRCSERPMPLREGGDVTIIGTGADGPPCCRPPRPWPRRDQARVLKMHTVKPLDNEAIMAAARETGAIVTVEEHSVIGGLGGAVAEWAKRPRFPSSASGSTTSSPRPGPTKRSSTSTACRSRT